MTELWEARELLWTFTLRELRVRYKQSFLGALWAIIQPLSLMVVFTIFFGGLAKLDSDGRPYPVFSYVGLLPWSLFAGALGLAIPSLAANADLITKVYFPRITVPLSSILVAGVDFLVAASIFIVMLFYYKISLTWMALYTIPLLLIQMVFTAGVCLFFSALNVFYRDVRFALPLVIQLWIYVVPVIYSSDIVRPEYRAIYMADPMAVVVDGFRKCLLKGQPPHSGEMLIGALLALLTLAIGLIYFRWVEQAFADIV